MSPPLPILLSISPLCCRRRWALSQGTRTPWRVLKQTQSIPSPWRPCQAKALELSPTSWCSGRPKPVRLSSAELTEFICTLWLCHNSQIRCTFLCKYSVHVYVTLYAAPDLVNLHFSVFHPHSPSCPPVCPLPCIHRLTVPSSCRAASLFLYTAMATWQMETEFRFSFFSPIFHFFHSLSVFNIWWAETVPLAGLQPVLWTVKGWWMACYVDRWVPANL